MGRWQGDAARAWLRLEAYGSGGQVVLPGRRSFALLERSGGDCWTARRTTMDQEVGREAVDDERPPRGG